MSTPKRKSRFGRDKIASKYQALEAKWYAKLRASGFVDIEPYGNPMNTRLIDHWYSTMRALQRGVVTGQAELYRLLYEWIDETRYRGRIDRFALAARCEGFDYNELADRFGTDFHDTRRKILVQVRRCLRSYGLQNKNMK
jgi:hypothetical protein